MNRHIPKKTCTNIHGPFAYLTACKASSIIIDICTMKLIIISLLLFIYIYNIMYTPNIVTLFSMRIHGYNDYLVRCLNKCI